MSSGNKGYVKLNTEPSSSSSFVQDSFQQQEVVWENLKYIVMFDIFQG